MSVIEDRPDIGEVGCEIVEAAAHPRRTCASDSGGASQLTVDHVSSGGFGEDQLLVDRGPKPDRAQSQLRGAKALVEAGAQINLFRGCEGSPQVRADVDQVDRSNSLAVG